ncbi:MAG TPA: hypothetical protein G4N95_09150 [Anaerolineae bacterium]|nr:hypothetical protein [Anaerolineae bacterium]
MMRIDLVFQHAIISLVGLGIGAIVGIPPGYAISRLAKRLSSDNAHFQKRFLFVPWRTLLVASLLVFLYPVIIMIPLGLGLLSGILSVGVNIFLIALVMTVDAYLIRQRADDEKVRISSVVRTLSVLSILLATQVGIVSGLGLGYEAYKNIRLLNFNAAIGSWLWMIFLALILDLVFGLVQYLFMKNKIQPAIAEEYQTT